MIDYQSMWQVLDDIQDERERQDQKFNDPPDWSNYDDATRFAVLFEETGEVARAYIENGPTSEELRDELVQVAAVAVKWIERLDALKARELLDKQDALLRAKLGSRLDDEHACQLNAEDISMLASCNDDC